MQAIFLAMFVPLRCSLTAMPSPVEPQPVGLPGAIMTWGTAGAVTNFLISAFTGWLVRDVTSMFPELQSEVDG